MKPKVRFRAAVTVSFLAGLMACSSEDSDSKGSGGSAGASCEDLSGTWTIVEHCQDAYIGETTTLSGSGCKFTGTDSVSGSTYTVVASGTDVSIEGQCSGTVSGDTWDWVCQACHQKLTR